MVSTLCGPTSISCRIWAPVLPLYFGRSATGAAAGRAVVGSFCNIDMGWLAGWLGSGDAVGFG